MGLSRRLHAPAFAVAAALAVSSLAVGQPPPGPGNGSGSGAGSALPAGVKPAGSSPVESSDVPVWRTSPPRFAVAPFENQSSVHAFDWLIAGAPFEIAEKTEDVLGLEPTGGSLHVGAEAVITEPDPVAAFAAARNAQWVITGFADRPRWQLRLGLTLWKVTGKTAIVVSEVAKTGEVKAYHQLLGDALAEMWEKGGVAVGDDKRARLGRSLATDLYAVNLMGRGLGYMTGALGAVNLKSAEHDLEKAVFIDPKCYEAQRLLGELYLVLAADPKAADPKLASRALGKFNYANDLAPADLASTRAAAMGASRTGKHEVAKDLWKKLVSRKPWDLDARYEYGAALWATGEAAAAQRQLEQVTAKKPDHLHARRVLVLIHSSRSDTGKLVTELEAIAARAPADLDVKGDLATAYGALGQWAKAASALEQIAASRPSELALLVRVGDARRRNGELESALTWYARASRLAPDSSFPGFLAAQTLFEAGRLNEAVRAYTLLQKFRDDLSSAEQALGAIAMIQNRPDDAAWYLRRAVREAPRNPAAWRALVAAELGRKDPHYAQMVVERALATWPKDGQLLYLAGVADAMLDDKAEARAHFTRTLELIPSHAGARSALGALDAGGAVTLQTTPELERPWGDAAAIEATLDRYAQTASAMATVRASYQKQFLTVLAALGKGPYAPVPVKGPRVRTCPVARIAPLWADAQQQLRTYERLGNDLEAAYRFVMRHDELGATAGLMPNARTQVANLKKSFRTTLADVGELRAEWVRSLVPELRMVNCSDKLLAAAVADPERYRLIEEDRPTPLPQQQPPRPKPRATFYVDNTKCPDPVDVFIDGAPLGQVAPGRRSALVADGGERTLCLIVPGAAQCGDRGTVRQVYLHDGWAATMHCVK